jgi:hypothetical protein
MAQWMCWVLQSVDPHLRNPLSRLIGSVFARAEQEG